MPLAPSILAEAARQARALAAAPHAALLLRSGSPAEGRAAACAVAAELDRRALFLESDRVAGLGPYLQLRGLLPVFLVDLGPGERRNLPPIPRYQGPCLALAGFDGSLSTYTGAPLTWPLAVPTRAERACLWEEALGDADVATELARHRHGCGRIAHLARLSRHLAISAGQASPRQAEVAAAAWTGEGGGLDALAQPLREPISEEALVMTPLLRRDLKALLLRCQHRDGLTGGLGASAAARYHPGVRALLVGPSGTGKTLAAGWLATRLGSPLYRVDLAAVTSKYIGETEKNLAQLLGRAEQAEVVLLFDEADSMFGRRTEVRDANDRFANAQTNYLLQRIETFDGIVLLTSNSRSRFDAAFTRRLDMVIEFPPPGPEERRALWQGHLGPHHGLEQHQLNMLAATVDLAGGHIRNVVLAAAVRARAGGRPIELADLQEGLAAEYRKLGRQLPTEVKGHG